MRSGPIVLGALLLFGGAASGLASPKGEPTGVERAPTRADDARWKRMRATFEKEWAAPTGERREAALIGLAAANRAEAARVLLRLLTSPADPHQPRLEKLRVRLTAERTRKSRALADARKKGARSDAAGRALAAYREAALELKGIERALWVGRTPAPIAVRALARMWDPEVLALLTAKGLGHRDPAVRAGVVGALVLGAHRGALPQLRRRIDDRSPRVAAAAIAGAARLADREALPRIRRKLDHGAWPVRAAAAAALAELRDPAHVPLLIHRLAREKGRLREDLDRALERLTGASFDGEVRAWRRWLAANRERLPALLAAQAARLKRQARREGQAGEGSVAFYGIRTRSRRICFVVDVSGSMQGPGGKGKGPTKIEVMRKELTAAVKGLRPGARFNVITFDHRVARLQEEGLVPLTPASRQKTIAWIARTLKPRGGTNIYDALDAAFRLRGIDTVFFMTDGAPGAGPVTDPKLILREFTQRNLTRQLRLHCIQVGGARRSWLEQLATRSGGRYVLR